MLKWEKLNAEAMIDLDIRKQIWNGKMLYVLDEVRNFDINELSENFMLIFRKFLYF